MPARTKAGARALRPTPTWRSSLVAGLAGAGALCLLLAACGDDTPATRLNFAPLEYGYLAKLRLNVGSIEVQDHTAPFGPNDVAATAPTPPAEAMAGMARDRLFAAGTAGRAVFVIDQASILRAPGGALDGQLAVHMDMLTEGGTRAGFAEARVVRQHLPGSDREDERGALYAMTRQMMDDMNVELEFQVRRSLKEWLVADGAAPAPVTAQPLLSVPQPGQVVRSPFPNLPQPALPPGLLPPASEGAPQPMPGQMLSPPPGYLQLPPTQ